MTELAGVGAAAEVLAGDPHRSVEAADARHSCANCDTPLQGAYCHACGQKAHLHTRLWHLLEEFAEGVAHFDGRLWRTLPLLAFRPGRLSRSWIEGKRVRFVAPLHVFLFGVFALFTTLALTGNHLDLYSPEPGSVQLKAAGPDPTGPVAAGDKAQPKNFGDKLEEALHGDKTASKYYAYKMESLTYKLAIAVVPLSMALLWLLMLFKRGYSLYDHGVVSLYGLGFFLLLATLLVPFASMMPASGSVVPDGVALPLFSVSAVHAVAHLRGAYRLTWLGALLRGLVLCFLSLVVFSFFMLGVMILGVSG